MVTNSCTDIQPMWNQLDEVFFFTSLDPCCNILNKMNFVCFIPFIPFIPFALLFVFVLHIFLYVYVYFRNY